MLVFIKCNYFEHYCYGVYIELRPYPLPEMAENTFVRMQTLSSWFGVEGDSRKALVAALTSLDASKRAEKFRQLVDWNPRLAAELARALFDHSGDITPLTEVLKRWAVSDPGAAGRQLIALPEEASKLLAPLLVEVVEKENPWAIGELVKQGDGKSWAEKEQEKAVSNWADHDPSAAAKWIASMDEEDMKRLAGRCLSNFQFYTETGDGWEIYLKHFGHLDVLESKDARSVSEGFVSASSWQEAESFMDSLPHTSAKTAYLASFLGTLQLTDSTTARQLFDESMPSEIKSQVARLLGPRLAIGGDDAWEWMQERSEYFDADAQADFLFFDALDPRDAAKSREKTAEVIAKLPADGPIPKRLLNTMEVMSAVGAGHDLQGTFGLGSNHRKRSSTTEGAEDHGLPNTGW